MDQEGINIMSHNTPVVEGRGIVKRYGHVTAIDHSDFELRQGEILAVIGDNGCLLYTSPSPRDRG